MLARGPRGGTSRGVRAAGGTSLSPPPLLRLLLLPALLHLAAAAAAAGQGGAAARRAGLASRRPSAAAVRRMRTAPCATYASQGLKVAKDTVSFRELLINRCASRGRQSPRPGPALALSTTDLNLRLAKCCRWQHCFCGSCAGWAISLPISRYATPSLWPRRLGRPASGFISVLSFRLGLAGRESCGGGECPRLSEVSLAGVPLEALPRNPLEGLG